MSYSKQTWVDGNGPNSTPITAERLNYMENGIGSSVQYNSDTQLNSIQSNNYYVVTDDDASVWLRQSATVVGTTNKTEFAGSYISMSDHIDNTSGASISALRVLDYVVSPATGGRSAITATCDIIAADASNIPQGSGYIGISAICETGATLGGTEPSPAGSLWAGWFECKTSGGEYHASIMGIEVDVQCESNWIRSKIGVRIVCGTVEADTTQGVLDDVALQIIKSSTPTATPWTHGIKFGTDQWGPFNPTDISQSWPFDDTCTIIGTSIIADGLPAGIGIDFSAVTFSGPAIKLPAASIAMAEMAAAPAAITGDGQLYVASDGSLHYLSPAGTDSLIGAA